MTKVIFSALGIKDYGPLVMSAAFVGSYIDNNDCDIVLLGSSKLHDILAKSYDFRAPGKIESYASSHLSSLPLLPRLLITSFVLPFVAILIQANVVYLDDSFSLLPFLKSKVLIHNPISCFSFKDLKKGCVSINLLRYALHIAYQFTGLLISRPLCIVQSAYISSIFTAKYRLSKPKVHVLDMVSLLQKYHPLLGLASNSRLSFSDFLQNSESLFSCKLQKDIVFSDFKACIFAACSPRTHKNPEFIVEAANKLPEILFITTLPISYCKTSIPSNLVFLGPLSHVSCLSLISSNRFTHILLPSRIETYGLPAFEAIALKKHLLLPKLPFFNVHRHHSVTFYNPTSCDSLMSQILLSTSS